MSHSHWNPAAFAAVIASNYAIGWTYDFLLYPAGIVFLGPFYGGILMTIGALLINYFLVAWYNMTERDWLGLEWLKNETEPNTWFRSMLRKCMRFGTWPAFILLSIYDPFYGFIFLRGRGQSRGRMVLTRTDWFWFVISNLIGNLAWIIVLYGSIESVEYFLGF